MLCGMTSSSSSFVVVVVVVDALVAAYNFDWTSNRLRLDRVRLQCDRAIRPFDDIRYRYDRRQYRHCGLNR